MVQDSFLSSAATFPQFTQLDLFPYQKGRFSKQRDTNKTQSSTSPLDRIKPSRLKTSSMADKSMSWPTLKRNSCVPKLWMRPRFSA